MRIVIPGVPPSVNHMYRRFTTKGGRTMNVTTKQAQAWMDVAALQAKMAANKSGWVCAPKGTKVVLRMWFWWPSRRRRDTHNATKGLLDALEGIVYEDDQYALPRIIDWGVDRANPRVEIEVELAEEAAG